MTTWHLPFLLAYPRILRPESRNVRLPTETSGSSELNALRIHLLARVFHHKKLAEEGHFLEESDLQSLSTRRRCIRFVLLSSLFPTYCLATEKIQETDFIFEVSAMAGNSNCTLVLCGKSPAENEIAIALKSSNALIPVSTELSILLQSEFEKPVKEDAFGVDSFMSLLSTSRFGRFLLWSPRLPSTHDVVSK